MNALPKNLLNFLLIVVIVGLCSRVGGGNEYVSMGFYILLVTTMYAIIHLYDSLLMKFFMSKEGYDPCVNHDSLGLFGHLNNDEVNEQYKSAVISYTNKKRYYEEIVDNFEATSDQIKKAEAAMIEARIKADDLADESVIRANNYLKNKE